MKRRTPIVPAPEDRMKSQTASEIVRRTEITIEREVVSMRFEPGNSFQGFCPECGFAVLMVTPEAASVAVGVTKRQIYRWIEESRFHVQESLSGDAFLCFASVASHRAGTANRGLLPGGEPGESL